MLEGIVGIIGVVIGFLFGEGAARIRESEKERKQAHSVRTIVCLEIARNLSNLRKFWDEILNTIVNDPDSRSKTLALKFIETPMPRWQSDALGSQMPHLAMALSEEEIIAVLKFYEQLDLLTKLRDDLFNSSRGTNSSHGSTRETTFSNALDFVQKAPRYWEHCEALVDEILSLGNPLLLRGSKICK